MDKTTNSALLIRLLCVEDDDDDWVDLQTMLAAALSYSEFGLSWTRCKSLRQAKRAIEEDPLDLVLLDLKLVDSVNPLETTRAVSEVAGPRGIPIVILSGLRDDPVITRECSLAGAFQHLQKGRYDAIDLLRAIDLSYERSQELRRQRDLYLKAQQRAIENLALAEQATGVLTGLRSDLSNFARNDRNRRGLYTVLLAAMLFFGFPSLEANSPKVKASNESIGLFTVLVSFIWGQGTFQERLKQAKESSEIADQIRSRSREVED